MTTETMREAVARAIEDADSGIGYQIRLVSLIDGVRTYTLDYDDGSPVLEFESHSDALDHFQKRRAEARADAAIRTVLERLREPSEAMIRVGTAAISFDPEPPADTGGDPDYEDEARYAWQSMLDAAAREVG